MNGPNSNNEDFSLFLELLNNLYNTSKKQLKFDEDVKVNFVKNDQNSLNPLGKTASYDPETKEINLYFVGRHPKDLMRSFSHELVHHSQNCRGDLDNASSTNEGYAQTDKHLREMEREAYECGNMVFRDWEDGIKKKGVVPLFDGSPFATILMGYKEDLGDKKMSNKLTESKLRDIIRGVIQEMFNDDLNEETTMDQMMQDNAEESSAIALGAGDEDVAVSAEGHDYATKGRPSTSAPTKSDEDNPIDYEKDGKIGGDVMETQELAEDSGEEESWNDWKNEHADDDHIEQIKNHLKALEHDRDYEEKKAEYDDDKYEDEGYDRKDEAIEEEVVEEKGSLNESYFPKGRDIREDARKQTYAKLVEKWCK